MALDGLKSFLCLKKLQIHVQVCEVVLLLAGILQYNGGKLDEVEDFK